MLTRFKSIIGLVLLCQAIVLVSQRTEHDNQRRYSNELPKLRFYENANWKALVPLASSIADVRRVLGEPQEAIDIAHYFDPYPGDDKAEAPVFAYEINTEWQILVYFVKDCRYEFNPKDISGNQFCTIELTPKKHLSFRGVLLPSVFTKHHVNGADAAWDEYRDAEGLAYYVYTTRTPYGGNVPGNLQRIVYGPSDEELKRLKMTRKKSPFDIQ